ncbi:G2/mitotic-specific cyclin B [Giardia muris]|uniref:G2/mitotic-specific cyclin B n=1 Tax=Giardia muris TaxID=5742 RepID=A0A4Z1SVX2_GIAMU|nr:G2/mitotic-specific cyclin B [Giardia muris]|eukprot:TNJ29914.1 G2/mitotic-specific cyclin B [Giardia muris]
MDLEQVPSAGVDTASGDVVEDVPQALLNFRHSNPDKETDILDIDLVDKDDIQACAGYVREIYEYLLASEGKYQLSPGFLDHQADFTAEDRTVLVDWIARCHTRFNLANESFFHCVTILDTYLSRCEVSRANSRLLGIACLFIAAKYEQSYIPSLRHFVDALNQCELEYLPICKCQNPRSGACYTCSREAIIEMEETVLHALDFMLAMPTILTFLRRYARICEMKNRDRYIAFYISELTCLTTSMLQFKPSEIAAGCIAMSRRLTRKSTWDETLEKYSGYSEADTKKVMTEISTILKKYACSSKARYIRRKYSQEDRFYGVSIMIESVVNQALNLQKGDKPTA